ncbi:hypothetical protein Pmar_PMAR016452 [Perkinsus marinus ATCC 50983]|uniref:Uncharacterized protein n=1 Tax=Perkinsus marinus (strain ATCC 50983 / TXsc) TaxID=423536 RepID=C5L1B3_PERM5|nr:hypothetical protein Pmar_PMAR016452 [Perkinsus marinus ATCC 50983]EER09520.1 hypothetical protein Pmar_PMAR016452 [Perkinsus marinus ATCC 50983]|eukprot:XP_002777704.1 hypothetical protein Pmar_PMAR016452 [Perkinsus marinus ATCC 50983]
MSKAAVWTGVHLRHSASYSSIDDLGTRVPYSCGEVAFTCTLVAAASGSPYEQRNDTACQAVPGD